MKDYVAEEQKNPGGLRIVGGAETLEDFALIAARALHFGDGIYVVRQTGEPGSSGMFQTYCKIGASQAATPVGASFLVREV